jgi:hypothetical protein
MRFRLFKAQDNVPSHPAFDGREPFDSAYARIKGMEERGEVAGVDPYPVDPEKMRAECIADEEDRLGRKLTEHERAHILDDPKDDDG